MTLQTLIRRSLRFHLRSHFGVMAGVAIGSAALTGALVVGDSVRGTLTHTALARLGPAYFAMFSGDRFFLATLRERLCSASSKSDRTKASPSVCPMTYAIMLPGVASRQDGSARANQVTIIGVEDPAWPEMANWAKLTDADNATKRWRAGEVAFINGALARQLNARSGDDIVLRIRKPSALGLDAAISPKNENTISLRLKIGVILDDAMVGDFSLSPGQTHPVNLFLPYEIMRKPLGMEERANLMLVGRITRDDAVHNEGSLATALKNDWLLEDAQLQVRV